MNFKKLSVVFSIFILFLLVISVSVSAQEYFEPNIPDSWYEAPQTASELGITEFDQSPMLDDKVAEGEIPPVEKRLPKDPPVIEHIDIGGVKAERQLFWSKLELKKIQKKILISTAHYAWSGHPHEAETGESPRVEQSRKTVDFLQSRPEENIFFMGDLNEPHHPRP